MYAAILLSGEALTTVSHIRTVKNMVLLCLHA